MFEQGTQRGVEKANYLDNSQWTIVLTTSSSCLLVKQQTLNPGTPREKPLSSGYFDQNGQTGKSTLLARFPSPALRARTHVMSLVETSAVAKEEISWLVPHAEECVRPSLGFGGGVFCWLFFTS